MVKKKRAALAEISNNNNAKNCKDLVSDETKQKPEDIKFIEVDLSTIENLNSFFDKNLKKENPFIILDASSDNISIEIVFEVLGLVEKENRILLNFNNIECDEELKSKIKSLNQRNESLLFNKAMQEKNRGKKNFIGIIKVLAEQSHVPSQVILADCYYKGEVIDKDLELAAFWYKEAAENGNIRAQYQLGMLYEKGKWETQDYELAVHWYEKAAGKGCSKSKYQSGKNYYYGRGVEQDYKKAFELFNSAAKDGHVGAMYFSAWFYEVGIGVEQNYSKAFSKYKILSKKGVSMADNAVGRFLKYGKGVEQDFDEAIKHFESAAEKGNKYANFHLGWMHLHGIFLKKDYFKAHDYFKNATHNDYFLSQLYLLIFEFFSYNQGELVNSAEEMVQFLKRESESGCAPAQFCLGFLYENEIIEREKGYIAKDLIKKAAENGYLAAKIYMIEYGNFTPISREEIKREKQEVISECSEKISYNTNLRARLLDKEQENAKIIDRLAILEKQTKDGKEVIAGLLKTVKKLEKELQNKQEKTSKFLKCSIANVGIFHSCLENYLASSLPLLLARPIMVEDEEQFSEKMIENIQNSISKYIVGNLLGVFPSKGAFHEVKQYIVKEVSFPTKCLSGVFCFIISSICGNPKKEKKDEIIKNLNCIRVRDFVKSVAYDLTEHYQGELNNLTEEFLEEKAKEITKIIIGFIKNDGIKNPRAPISDIVSEICEYVKKLSISWGEECGELPENNDLQKLYNAISDNNLIEVKLLFKQGYKVEDLKCSNITFKSEQPNTKILSLLVMKGLEVNFTGGIVEKYAFYASSYLKLSPQITTFDKDKELVSSTGVSSLITAATKLLIPFITMYGVNAVRKDFCHGR